MPLQYFDLLFCIFTASIIVDGASGLNIESVVGGLKVDSEEYLYQASLIRKGHLGDEPDAPCAAATIDNDHLVSVASCFYDNFDNPDEGWYEVRVGTINLLYNTPKVIGVEKIYIPGNYDWKTSANNIAVIKLNNSLDYSIQTHLCKVDLPLNYSSFIKKVAILSGYGHHAVSVIITSQISYQGTRDWNLRQVYVKVLDNSKCSRSWPSVLDSQLCGKSLAQRKGRQAGACLGDLGAPLVFKNTLIGVLSKFNPLCDEREKPSIYTRISSVQSFIESVLNGRPPNDTRVLTEKAHTSGASISGDLGGPLVFENKLIRVLSRFLSRFHAHCIGTREPAIYTRVSSVQYVIQSVFDGSPPDNTRVDTDYTLSNGIKCALLESFYLKIQMSENLKM